MLALLVCVVLADVHKRRVIRGETVTASKTTQTDPFDFCPRDHAAAAAAAAFDVINDAIPLATQDKLHWASVQSLFGTHRAVSVNVNDPRTDTYISASLLGGRATWEPDIVRAMRRALKTGCSRTALVVDVGANVGYFSAIAAAEGCRVISFEPVSSNVRALHRTGERLAAAVDWTIYRNAVSDVTGIMVHLKTAHAKVNAGNYKIVSNGAGTSAAITVRLDDVLPRQDVAFLKVDTEGYEAHVVAGASRLFCTHTVHAVVLELMHDVERSGCDWKRMLLWFKCMGYTLRSMRTGALLQVRERDGNVLLVLEDGKKKKSCEQCEQKKMKNA